MKTAAAAGALAAAGCSDEARLAGVGGPRWGCGVEKLGQGGIRIRSDESGIDLPGRDSVEIRGRNNGRFERLT